MLQPIQNDSGRHEPKQKCPDATIVIVSWNVRDDLLRCLSAIFADVHADSLSTEIIVVDNASTDGTVESLSGLPVKIITNDSNVGYGRANNIGLQAAAGDYLLILNPDTVPQPGAIKALVSFAQANPKAGIVAPRLLNPDGTTQSAAFRFPTLLMVAIDLFPLPSFVPGRLRLWLRNSRLNGRYSQELSSDAPFRIDHPLGACLLIRRDAYEECGGFDEQIFMYSEEIDLAIRYSKAGWESWQVPASKVVHLGGQSSRQMPVRMFVELWRSRLYICAKYYSRVDRILLRSMLTVAMLRDLAATAIRRTLGVRRDSDKVKARRAKAVLRLMKRR